MSVPQFDLVVNEIMVMTYTTRAVRDWWVEEVRPPLEASRLLRIVVGGFPAPISELGPWSQQDAEFARDHMVEKGVPKSALKLRPWTTEPKPAFTRTCGGGSRA